MPYVNDHIALLRAVNNGLEAEGATLQKTCDVDTVTGPLPGTLGISGIGNGEVSLRLPEALSQRGTVSYWLRTPAAILNGKDTRGGGETFFELPGLLVNNLWWYSGYSQINFRFTTEGGLNHAVELPGLPGPQWMHFCYAWDAPAGLLQGYINGTPTRLPGVSVPVWETGEGSEIRLAPGAWAIAEMRFYDRPLDPDEAESLVPPLYRGALDSLIGAQPRGNIDTAALRGELIYENKLDTEQAIAGWRMEGPGVVRFDGGWMHMESAEPDTEGNTGHIVHWCDRDFPADFLAEFEIQPESEHGLTILFFCAKGCNGEDIFDPSLKERNGVFAQYTGSDINCYHVSYYANTPGSGRGRSTSNLRKNSGFWLVDQGPIGINPGSRAVHKISVLKHGARIELAVDARRVIRWFDPGDRYAAVLGEGKIGFRQMKWMQARYRDFRVYSVK